ncbi:glycoside hydrolase superfamily [Fimicolochytrium jonesii]|uniref:glycoside hydrolase superfamily n=1 Tax=Fimicolochytrium jonesii TaxID=1396493 RepID=UPI0022FF4145|nr:glycoside hydrolase superfamily [Fimicolochytrium jonesii]KAI8818413.1 glycoside hydrolase superfamily [Fimicolochytrium jonesii]
MWHTKLGKAHEWSGPLKQQNGHFRDQHGRVLQLRGVNASGNSKLPTSPPGSTHLSEGFFEHRNVSFIGRPFPLDEADQHFSRLRSWGLTFVRLCVTWEALEHSGPGAYDEEFIDYLIELLAVAEKYGIHCFIDPHQDTWSRFSGGSGAPGWTFEVVGMDVTKFMDTNAAYVHQCAQPEDSGHSAWPTNYQKLASATMFTIFFGGKIFAPKAIYKGEHPQDYLQRHFIASFQHLAKRLRNVPCVIGFEVINEPHPGFIGLESVHAFDPLKDLHIGPVPSAFQSMALASGIPQEVDFWVRSWPWPTRRAGKRLLNQGKASAWLPGRECVWKQHGVWDIGPDGVPRCLNANYFARVPSTGERVNFDQDCYVPFIKRYTDAIVAANPSLFVFFEPVPNEAAFPISKENDSPQLVYAPHWYDLKVLFNKAFNSLVTHDVRKLQQGALNLFTATYVGVTGTNKNYMGQIKSITDAGRKLYPEKAIVFGECGLAMDINSKHAFDTGDYTQHTIFLNAMLSAMEGSLVNFTLWNYNPHNDNVYGDHWNGEDFSIFSRIPAVTAKASSTGGAASSAMSAEEPELITHAAPFDITERHYEEGHRLHEHHVGGRALDAVVRPYAAKIAGEPVFMRFDINTLEFVLEFTTPRLSSSVNQTATADTVDITRITEIFVPGFHYTHPSATVHVEVSDGEWMYDATRQTLYYKLDPAYQGAVEGAGKPGNSGFWNSIWAPSTEASVGEDRVLHRIVVRPVEKDEAKASWWTAWWT